MSNEVQETFPRWFTLTESISQLILLLISIISFPLYCLQIFLILRNKSNMFHGPFYRIMLIGMMIDVLSVFNIFVGQIGPARKLCTIIYTWDDGDLLAKIFYTITYGGRGIQGATAMLLALNRVSAVCLPIFYRKLIDSSWNMFMILIQLSGLIISLILIPFKSYTYQFENDGYYASFSDLIFRKWFYRLVSVLEFFFVIAIVVFNVVTLLSFHFSVNAALTKILTPENQDTAENRENIRQLVQKAMRNQVPRKMGRQSLSAKNTTRVYNGPRNNHTQHLEKINEQIHEYTFESDIMLNLEQAKNIAEHLEKGEGRAKRQAIIKKSLFWDVNTPIYYQFDTQLSSTNIANVRKAIQFWNDNSCLSFEESSTGPNRLYLTSAGGCWSYVGKQSSNYQLVSVGPGCDGLGTACHELAHALGFWHTQSRADRDNYVFIDYSNIQPGLQYNFQKMSLKEAQLLGLPYDYGSVMQYWPYSFAVDSSKLTVYAKNSLDENSMGQRESPAFSDIRMVNTLYNCTKQCSTQLACQNSGFTDSRNCQQCKCPHYFTGALCDKLAQGSAQSCNGQVVEANSTWTKFSGVAGDASSYTAVDTATDCYWHIKAKPGQKIQMRITKSLESAICMEQCPWQAIEINMGKFDVFGWLICCDTNNNKIFTSESNLIAIRGIVRYNQINFTVEYRTIGEADSDVATPPSSAAATSCQS